MTILLYLLAFSIGGSVGFGIGLFWAGAKAFQAGCEAATEICADMDMEIAAELGVQEEWIEATERVVGRSAARRTEVAELERMHGRKQ